MENFNWKNKLIIVTTLTVLLTGCGARERTEDRTLPDTGTSGVEETHIAEEKTDEKTDERLQPSHTEVTLLDTKPIIDENAVLYGNLHITLPDGVTAQQQALDKGAVVIDFPGAEANEDEDKYEYGKSGPLPPRIWFRNYQMVYESRWELLSALMDLLPDTSLCVQKVTDASEYVFTYESDYKNGYILVHEDDIYIVEDIKAEWGYNFEEFLNDKLVLWENTQNVLAIGDTSGRANKKLYDKIDVEKHYTLFVLQSVDSDNTRRVLLFRDGYFDSAVAEFSFAEASGTVVFEDCNFDGCPDIMVSETNIYLWNTKQKTYEPAQMPKDFEKYSWKTERYPDTQTIWGYDDEYGMGPEHWSDVDHKEMLWKWEGTALVKKRECIANVREEGVRIRAYEGSPENVLFDETFTKEEWEQNSVQVQKRYQQFYAGMIPEENDEKLHRIDYNQEHIEYIPQALLDIITNTMLDGKKLETLEGMVNDKKLTTEEALALAKDNLALRSDMIGAVRSGNVIAVMTDADNDGIADIVAQEFFGGTAGFTEYVFYKGQEDGTYQRTSSYDAVKEKFAVLSYDGKNYLCRILYDYNKKIYDGIFLACYVDGVQVQTATLTLFPEAYDVKLTECTEEKYKAYAEEIFQNSLGFKEMIDEYKSIDGSSEEKLSLEEQYKYQCDLDNDNVAEQYNKSIWEPSNMGTFAHLNFYGEGEGIEHTNDALEAADGRSIMMWVEPFEGENIINVISLTGLHDFEITGFLLNGAEYTRIYRITAEVTYGVSKELSTQMHRVNV